VLHTACDSEAFISRETLEKGKLHSLMDQNEYETDADKPDHMLSLYQFIRKFAKLLEKSFFHHLNLVK